MSKSKKCKVCGIPSGHANVCPNCKAAYPNKIINAKGDPPFNRISIFKDKRGDSK